MKKIVLIFLAVIVLIFASVKLYYVRGYFGSGIRQCPEDWYDNQMPGPQASGDRQYLIIDGKHYQLSEVNVKWIQSNCEVNKPSIAS
jgi:hypothetical protein